MLLRFAVIGRLFLMRRTSGVLVMRACPTVRLVQLLSAIGPFKFMALAGNAEHANSHYQEREKFHRAASITSRHRNATPKEIEIHPEDLPSTLAAHSALTRCASSAR